MNCNKKMKYMPPTVEEIAMSTVISAQEGSKNQGLKEADNEDDI